MWKNSIFKNVTVCKKSFAGIFRNMHFLSDVIDFQKGPWIYDSHHGLLNTF